MEIAIESIVASGEDVFAAVCAQDSGTPDGPERTFEITSPIWSTMERFRVEDGRIIERSTANQNLIVIQERFGLPLQLDADLQDAYLATHWGFDVLASKRFQTSGGPAALHVLSGELAISVISDASASGMQVPVMYELASEDSNPVPADEVVRLPQGSTLTLPKGVAFVTTPDEPASALVVSREGISPLGPGSDAGPSESVGAEARHLGALLFDLEFERSLTLRFHRIVLMPGALVTTTGAPDASAALMWLESGRLLTERSRPPDYGAGTVNTNRKFASGVQLTPDDRLAYLWEPGTTFHNTGSEPAALWVLSTEIPAR